MANTPVKNVKLKQPSLPFGRGGGIKVANPVPGRGVTAQDFEAIKATFEDYLKRNAPQGNLPSAGVARNPDAIKALLEMESLQQPKLPFEGAVDDVAGIVAKAGPGALRRGAGMVGRGLRNGAMGIGAGIAIDTLGKYGVNKGYTDMDAGDLWQASQEVFSANPGVQYGGVKRFGQAFDDASTRNAMRGLQAPESPLKSRLPEIDPDFSAQGPTVSRQAVLSGIAPEGSIARQTKQGTPRMRSPKRALGGVQELAGRQLQTAPQEFEELNETVDPSADTQRIMPDLNSMDFQQMLATQDNPELGGAKKQGFNWKQGLIGALGGAILGRLL